MNRRKFLKVISMGSAILFLSGCGMSVSADEKVLPANNVSEGNRMKIVVINSSPHSEKNSTSKFLSGCGMSVSADEKVLPANNVSEGNRMKIVVINSSPHSEKNSTSKYLAQKFIEGAQSAGHEIFTFDAAREETHPCQGCDHCGMDGDCLFKDAISTKLMPKMLEADLLVLVTPLYYYGMSSQLKTIVDRFYSRTNRLNGKKSMIIATAWNSADWTMEALKAHYETLVRYMNWQDVGQIWAVGCGTRSLVERSEFGEVAHKIGANL